MEQGIFRIIVFTFMPAFFSRLITAFKSALVCSIFFWCSSLFNLIGKFSLSSMPYQRHESRKVQHRTLKPVRLRNGLLTILSNSTNSENSFNIFHNPALLIKNQVHIPVNYPATFRRQGRTSSRLVGTRSQRVLLRGWHRCKNTTRVNLRANNF